MKTRSNPLQRMAELEARLAPLVQNAEPESDYLIHCHGNPPPDAQIREEIAALRKKERRYWRKMVRWAPTSRYGPEYGRAERVWDITLDDIETRVHALQELCAQRLHAARKSLKAVLPWEDGAQDIEKEIIVLTEDLRKANAAHVKEQARLKRRLKDEEYLSACRHK